MAVEIQILALDRKKDVGELKWLMGTPTQSNLFLTLISKYLYHEQIYYQAGGI